MSMTYENTKGELVAVSYSNAGIKTLKIVARPNQWEKLQVVTSEHRQKVKTSDLFANHQAVIIQLK